MPPAPAAPGGGGGQALDNNWSVRLERRYSDFGHFADRSSLALLPTITVPHHFTASQLQLGLTYALSGVMR